MKSAVVELQGIRQRVVAGAASAADIAVPGLDAGDVIVGCIENNAGALTDRFAVASVVGAALRVAADTTGHTLIVTFIHTP